MDEAEKTCLLCPSCSVPLKEPYIKCAQCPQMVKLCLKCFGQGFEFGSHQNNHSYTVMIYLPQMKLFKEKRDDFPLFDAKWTAAEEIKLISLIAEFGFGNWSDVAQQMKTKNKQECERHYIKYFIEKPSELLPKFPDHTPSIHPHPVVFKLSEDPPRPQEGSPLFWEMGGYMAARGDFNVEHNNFVELELKDMTFDEEREDFEQEDEDEHFMKELKLAVVRIYKESIKERCRRKKIIRDYGLINLKKILHFSKRYDCTIKNFVNGIRVFNRLMSPVEFDIYVESLHYEEELKRDIKKLQEYRENGLRLHRQQKIFNCLKVRRESEKNEHHLLSEVLSNIQNDAACKNFLQRQAVLEHISKGQPLPLSLPTAPRRSAPPLDIVGLPGYDKLFPNEKELCAIVRLVPDAYLEFKRLLEKESQKYDGTLKLAQARHLIKIDVNKTRKLYDFLVQEKIIRKAPP